MNEWIPKLAGQRILVVGDLILDEYLIGKAARMSREAPVPVLEFETRQLIPGGAANPAANITALGSQAVQVGVVGSDTAATNLRQVLQARGIETNCLITDSGRPTTVKTRTLGADGFTISTAGRANGYLVPRTHQLEHSATGGCHRGTRDQTGERGAGFGL